MPTVVVTTELVTLPTFLDDATPLHTLPAYYSAALRRSGLGMVLVADLMPDEAADVLGGADGLVVIGGTDIDPASYGHANTHSVGIDRQADARDMALIRAAQHARLPLLAICRGLQALCVAQGASMRQEVNGGSDDHPALAAGATDRIAHTHLVELDPASRLAEVYGETERKVNSLHHQAVDEPGAGMRVVGRSPDGTIEAVEPIDASWPVYAVQWHPEMMSDPAEDRLFAAFAADAAAFRAQVS